MARKKKSAAAPTATKRKTDEPREELVPIVGVGASAGGLEAFKELLQALPVDTGMAFVLVSHLSHTHKSLLSEILARATSMPVTELSGSTAVQPNHVYVIPPNGSLTVQGPLLSVNSAPAASPRTMVIDDFLMSLAADRMNLAIGVILSGTGSDGSRGLAAVKAGAGITFVQDDRSARYPDMPRSAGAKSGTADFVLSPTEIARQLGRIARHPYAVGAAPAADGAWPESDLAAMLDLVRTAAGIDFADYKPSTVKRRIARRMVLHHCESPRAYIKRLRSDPKEVEALSQELLISVTGFFRDQEAFQALGDSVIPKIFEARRDDRPIRAWTAGCATGEETYSIAILLIEAAEKFAPGTPIHIFATDVNQACIHRAREGRYPEAIAADVSPERLARFFVKVGGGYRISKSVRDLCVFAVHNVVSDPPFSRLDLVTCRNLLIYLGTSLQKRVLARFHYALNPTGYVMLGSAETVGAGSEWFAPVVDKHKIYSRKASGAPRDLDLGLRVSPAGRDREPKAVKRSDSESAVEREADRALLSRFAPPGAVVDSAFNVELFRGHVGSLLEPASGKASLNLLRLARREILTPLKAALYQARKTHKSVRKSAPEYFADGVARRIAVEVAPLPVSGAAGDHFLVTFHEMSRPDDVVGAAEAPAAAESGKQTSKQLAEALAEIAALKAELSSTYQDLHSIIEEQESTNEELQSANEEVLSSNEELQSTNEELETAREELQAANEEMSTVNEELRNRNAELSKMSDDMNNLLASVDILFVMLGSDLRVRRFTPCAERVLNLIPGDIGRSIADIRTNLDVPDLAGQLRQVIDTLQPVEREVRDSTGRWHLMRARPYRTDEKNVEGVIFTLVDIHELKRGREELRRRDRSRGGSVFHSEPDFVLDDAEAGRILLMSPRIGMAESDGAGESFYDYLPPEVRRPARDCLLGVVSTGAASEFRTTRLGALRKRSRFVVEATPLKEDERVVAVSVKARTAAGRGR